MRSQLAVLLAALMSGGPAFGHAHADYVALTPRSLNYKKACEAYEIKCEGFHPDNVRGCMMLLTAAKASGGIWGQPADRARAGVPGRPSLCSP